MSDRSKNFANKELDYLESNVPDAVILPFKEEIITLVEKFRESGQSGSTSSYVASAISETIKKLMLYQPICGLIGNDEEWSVIQFDLFQNKRCTALFKNPITKKCNYLGAIVWKDENSFTGSVYKDKINFELITSSQFVTFPFQPKTFYIEVKRIYITKEEAESKNLNYLEDTDDNYHHNQGVKYYYYVIKDSSKLDEVFEYYPQIN